MRTAFTGFRRRLTGTTALTVLAAGALALSGGYAGAVTINDGVTVIAGTLQRASFRRAPRTRVGIELRRATTAP